MANALRRLGFAGVHALVVALYMRGLCEVLPPLRDEPGWLVVIPTTAIAALVLAAFHGPIAAARTHDGRMGWLLVATGVAMALYATFVVLMLPGVENPIGFAILVLLAQAFYGLPLFLVVALVAKLTSPWLIARPIT